MKFRNLLLLVAVAAFGFSSCDLESLTPTTTVETDVEVDLPLEADSQKSADEQFSFKGEGKVNLAENEDLKDYIENLKDFTAEEGSTFIIENMPADTVLYSVLLKVKLGDGDGWVELSEYASTEGYGNGSEITILADDITAINTVFVNWKNDEFKKDVHFKVSGTTNVNLGDASVKLDPAPGIKLKVKASVKVGTGSN